MADTNNEYGGIKLSVKIDTKQITSDVSQIVNKCKDKFKQLGNAISNAFKGGMAQANQAMTPEMEKMQKQYDKLQEKIAETEQEIERLMTAQSKLQSEYGFQVGDELYLPDNIQEQWEEMGIKIDGLAEKLRLTKEQAQQLKTQMSNVGGETKSDGGIFTQFGKKASNAISSITKRIGTMLTRLLIIQTIYKVIRAVLNYFGSILKADEDIRKDWEDIKTALKAAIEPFVGVLVPVVKTLTSLIKDFAIALGQVSAMLTGKSYSELVESAKATQQAADAYEDMADSSAETAKNAEKQLASFDDIQILKSDDDKDGDYSSYDRLASGAYDTNDVVTTLQSIMTAAGGALLAIGLILLSKGVVTPVTLGLIAAGAAVYSIGELLGNENVVAALQGWVGTVTAIVSAALLVLGVIMCFSGVGIPLGISLIAAGALGLGVVVAVNWDGIVSVIKKTVNSILDWVKTYGLLVLGIILCVTGVGLTSGIALIYKWAKDNAEKVELANKIVTVVKNVWSAIQNFWNTHIAPIFTAQWWLNLGKNCINGLIAGFEGGINGIISAFESMINWIVGGLNKISFDIPDWLGGGTFGINLPEAHLGRISIPRLAQGGVIPANKEFLAVLGDQKHGTNIETPLETMIEAFNTAMDSRSDTVKEERYFLGETELMQIIYKLAKKGERLQGTDLIV